MSGCGATCGINKEREREREAALAAVARAYPGFRWRQAKGDLALCLGIGPDAIVALGRELEELLPVRAIFRPGPPGACDWLYLLAGVHAPSLVEIADGAAPCEGAETASTVDETYVRLGFSPLGPYVTIQEVVVHGTRDGDGTTLVVEEPQMGVADRRLQAIVKGLQGKLRKAKLVVLDMAFLAKPVAELVPEGPEQDAFSAAFGAEPSLFAFLFEAEPPSATRASWSAR